MKTKAILVLGAFGLATVLSACGGSDQAQATYCVDASGMVLDEDYCDPDNSHYNPTFIYWYSYDDDHHYKKGKKIPGGDFRKGTTSAPAKPSATKPSSTAKPSAATSKPSAAKPSAPKASTPKAQAPKPAPAPKPQAPKPPAPKPPAPSKK